MKRIRWTHCWDMAIRNIPRCEVGRRSVGRQYIHCSHVLLFAMLGTWRARSENIVAIGFKPAATPGRQDSQVISRSVRSQGLRTRPVSPGRSGTTSSHPNYCTYVVNRCFVPCLLWTCERFTSPSKMRRGRETTQVHTIYTNISE